MPIDELPPYDPEQHIRTYPMVRHLCQRVIDDVG